MPGRVAIFPLGVFEMTAKLESKCHQSHYQLLAP